MSLLSTFSDKYEFKPYRLQDLREGLYALIHLEMRSKANKKGTKLLRKSMWKLTGSLMHQLSIRRLFSEEIKEELISGPEQTGMSIRFC